MNIIVCGIAGTGKSTIGKELAQALGKPFYDGDDFHPETNVQKMQSGQPLNDDDRAPWLAQLAEALCHWEATGGAVLACSALKEAYRITLTSKTKYPPNWVTLVGSEQLLNERLANRKGHFFNADLLRSQIAAQEIPEYGLLVDIQPTPQQICATILANIQDKNSSESDPFVIN